LKIETKLVDPLVEEVRLELPDQERIARELEPPLDVAVDP